jgi:signal transduction histidine kinase
MNGPDSGADRISLAGQLFRRILVLLGAIIIVIGAMMFWTAQDQINKLYDGQLITGANVLRALMSDEIKEQQAGAQAEPLEIGDELLSSEDRKAFDAYADWRMFRIWKRGQLMLASDTGPKMPPPTSTARGFSTEGAGGQAWRIFSLPLSNAGVTVQVGERVSIRSVFINRIMLELAVPLLLLIPISLVLIWLSLTDGLRALRILVGEISRRGPANLKPLELHARPHDLEPLAISVNGLMGRLEQSYLKERRFIDNAAHQLRTPLAALSLQAQLIAREDDPTQRDIQVVQLRAAVARAAELTEQLLTLARIGPSSGDAGSIDLHAEASGVLAESALVAAAQGVSLALGGQAPAFDGDPALARLILSNLVENAVTHSPPGAEVQVTLSASDEQVFLRVSDRGPGVPGPERERVFERFFRGVHATGSGAGLGLSIVDEAVRNLGGVVTLGDRSDGLAGLEVQVILPRRPR